LSKPSPSTIKGYFLLLQSSNFKREVFLLVRWFFNNFAVYHTVCICTRSKLHCRISVDYCPWKFRSKSQQSSILKFDIQISTFLFCWHFACYKIWYISKFVFYLEEIEEIIELTFKTSKWLMTVHPPGIWHWQSVAWVSLWQVRP
jgi:hypothetical protein